MTVDGGGAISFNFVFKSIDAFSLHSTKHRQSINCWRWHHAASATCQQTSVVTLLQSDFHNSCVWNWTPQIKNSPFVLLLPVWQRDQCESVGAGVQGAPTPDGCCVWHPDEHSSHVEPWGGPWALLMSKAVRMPMSGTRSFAVWMTATCTKWSVGGGEDTCDF